MERYTRRGKKRARKVDGDSQAAVKEIKIPAKFLHSTYEDEEQFVDYEPEESGVFSAAEDEVMRSDDNMPAHGDGLAYYFSRYIRTALVNE